MAVMDWFLATIKDASTHPVRHPDGEGGEARKSKAKKKKSKKKKKEKAEVGREDRGRSPGSSVVIVTPREDADL